MKLLIILGVFFGLCSGQVAFASADTISGTVTITHDAEKALNPKGVLFVIARPAGTSGGMPLAVLRIPTPKFPQKFSIGANNSMMGGKFEGSMAILARYAKDGNALDKTGPQGIDPKNPVVKPGKSDIKIELALPKK